jgi:cytochrome c oxidase assembly protein Cox11
MKTPTTMSLLDELENGIFRNSNFQKVRLSAVAKVEVKAAWDSWTNKKFNPYITGNNTRTLYHAANQAGKNLVAVQTKHGVWLIHPTNATAGLLPDDPRIID